MDSHHFLAFDLGAESGRAFLGILTNNKLQIQEIHRFKNGFVTLDGRLHWDVPYLFSELKKAMTFCSHCTASRIESIAIDTWGVDFGLLSSQGELLQLPLAYRDHFTDGMVELFSNEIMSLKDLYQMTGIQTMQINTLFQLYALHKHNPFLIQETKDLLFMPDLLNFLFTGTKKTEYSIATTSQLIDPYTKKWAEKLFDAVGIPVTIMQEIIQQGDIVGQVHTEICRKTGLEVMPVISVASHDTGSAIAAIPAEGHNWAFLSSGTWSLMGIETRQPIINDESARMNFTNEGGVDGTGHFMKNSCGLWLLQQCKKAWEPTFAYSYEDLVNMAEMALPFKIILDPDAPEFLYPLHMPSAIDNYCIATGQPTPASHAEYIRCIFDSLAMKYREIMVQLQRFSPVPIQKLYIIGGGAKNKLLCQLTANALGMPVITGPSEATAIGNLMMQAKALKYVKTLSDIRVIIRDSFEPETYQPQGTLLWDEKEQEMKYLHQKNN